MATGMTRDEIRTAGLLFGEELALGLVEPEALQVPEVMRAVHGMPVPSAVGRWYQERQLRRGGLGYERYCAQPLMAARRAVLGSAAEGRPKVLLRVPALLAGADAAAVLARHEQLHAAAVPYLLPVGPGPHDDAMLDVLARLRRDGVAFATHAAVGDGRPKAIDAAAQQALEELRAMALHADVHTAPGDVVGPRAWPVLAGRFDVVAGGPGSIARLGFHVSPSWRGNAVWLPAYAPLHGPAAMLVPAIQALVASGTGLWIAATLTGDADDALVELLGGQSLARAWDDFLLAVRASRQLALAMEPAGR